MPRLIYRGANIFFKIIFVLIICSNSPINNHDDSSYDNTTNRKIVVEWNNDNAGLFSNLMRVAEWMYCVKQNNNLVLYVNMNTAYGFSGNIFSVLFKPFEDSKITTNMPNCFITHQFTDFPRVFNGFEAYATDDMKHFSESKYIYMNAALYTDPDFSLLRERLNPIISQYLRPAPELQDRINIITNKMNDSLICSTICDQNVYPSPSLKIGIHVRCLQHYIACNKTQAQFLDDVERDVDNIMKSKDLQTTQIFLATLLEPLVTRLCAKYNVVINDIPRIPDTWTDWGSSPNANNLDAARDALIDLWCLASCDEVWGGSSNMMIFAGCLNPKLKIYMLPSLEKYDGS